MMERFDICNKFEPPLASSGFNPSPRVSVLIAVRNEEQHLSRSLNSLLYQDCPADWLEVLVLDGGSTDNTKAIASQFIDRLPALRVLDNPKVLSAGAWNLGLELASAEIISILSGHVELPTDFYSTLIPMLTSDIVGVGGLAIPVGEDRKSKTIAAAFSSVLGNGGASFMSSRAEGPVETVAFGCYWKKALQEVGGFDEKIVRGQDWDLNLRLRSNGQQLHYTPAISTRYYTRTSFKALWRRQYLAGLWKRYIHLKSKRPFLVRHRIPAFFIAALATSILAALAWPPAIFTTLLILILHLGAVVWQFSKLTLPASELPNFWWSLLLIHSGYGAGILVGSLRPPASSEK